MAITAEARTELIQLVVGMFGAAPGASVLSDLAAARDAGQTVKQIAANVANTNEFKSIYPTFLTNQEFAERFVNNLVGSEVAAADKASAVTILVGQLNAGATRSNVVVDALNALKAVPSTNTAWANAAAALANKVAVATYYSVDKQLSGSSLAQLQSVLAGVTSSTASVTAAKAVVDGIVNAGQVFTLTTGVDSVLGTDRNDTINGLLDSTIDQEVNQPASTFTALDVINGGAGVDTLNLNAITDVYDLPTVSVSGVEIVNIRAAEDFEGDFSNFNGLTNLNLTLSGDDVLLKAANTTAVAVSGVQDNISVEGGSTVDVIATKADSAVYIDGAAGAVTVTHTDSSYAVIEVYGGTTVSVTASRAEVETITVGSATVSDQPSGAITISSTGEAYDAGDSAISRGAIETFGGTSVTITQVATSSSAAAAADGTNTGNEVTQSAVKVTGGASTTSVTLNQSAAVTAKNYTAAAGANETQVVIFEGVAADTEVIVNGLSFIAAKALTAAEVAAAFANLAKGAYQGSAPASNGYYEGVFNGVSGTTGSATATSATTSTVTFKSAEKSNVGNIAVNNATLGTVVDGAATAGATGVMGVKQGKVEIDGNITGTDVLSTAWVNGFAASSTIKSDALTSLTLANSTKDITVTNAAATTLALTLNAVGSSSSNAVVNLGSTYTALNVTASGASSDVDITANGVKALTVSGDKSVVLTGSTMNALETVTVTGAAGLTITADGSNVTSVNTTGTTGSVTAKIDASKATYTGGAGVDKVEVTNSSVAKAISLGGGADTLTLKSDISSLTASISGGDGTDTLVMGASSAATASANGLFQLKMDSFEKLSLTKVVGQTSPSIDLANLDGISYVISAGTDGTNPGVEEVQQVTFSGLLSGQSVTVGGYTYTASSTMTAGDVAAAVAAADAVSDWVVDGISGTTVYFRATTVGDKDPLVVSTAAATPVVAPTIVTTPGASPSSLGTQEVVLVTFALSGTNPNTDTIVFNGKTVYLTSSQTNATLVAEKFATDYNTANGDWTATHITSTAQVSLQKKAVGVVSPNLTTSSFAITNNGNGDVPSVTAAATLVEGSAAVGGTTETALVTFKPLTDGQSVTIAGKTVTATGGNLTDAQVASAYVSGSTGNAIVTGSTTGWDLSGLSGANLTFTSTATLQNVDNLTATVNDPSAPSLPVVAEVDPGEDGTSLMLHNMANNGTLELTGAGAGATVVMMDATGSADVLNIITKVESSNLNFGTVDVAGVETIMLTATDTKPTDSTTGLPAISKATLSIVDSKLKSVEVKGESDLSLTADSAVLTSMDASAATGKITFGSSVDNAVIKGGSAADTLSAYGSSQTLNGGAGDDVLEVYGDTAVLIGGAGNDTFVITTPSSTANSYSTINDFSAGDMIQFYDMDDFFSQKVTLLGTADFEDYLNSAISTSDAYDVRWFQYGGDTFIVQNYNDGLTFDIESDIVVRLVGTYDLSTASINITADTLMIG